MLSSKDKSTFTWSLLWGSPEIPGFQSRDIYFLCQKCYFLCPDAQTSAWSFQCAPSEAQPVPLQSVIKKHDELFQHIISNFNLVCPGRDGALSSVTPWFVYSETSVKLDWRIHFSVDIPKRWVVALITDMSFSMDI